MFVTLASSVFNDDVIVDVTSFCKSEILLSMSFFTSLKAPHSNRLFLLTPISIDPVSFNFPP